MTLAEKEGQRFGDGQFAKSVLPQHNIAKFTDSSLAPAGTPIPNENLEPFPEPDFNLLTAKEREIAVLRAKGKRAKEIADSLRLSINTVNNYSGYILDKLGLKSGSELAIAGFKAGLVPVEELKEAIGYKPEMFGSLSARELEVAYLLTKGLKASGIADKLVVAERTVENHIKSIRKKMHLPNEISKARIVSTFLIREKEEGENAFKVTKKVKKSPIDSFFQEANSATRDENAQEEVSVPSTQTRFDIIRGNFEILPNPYFQPLTAAEKNVLILKLKGKTAKEIARALVTSVRTVDNHCYSIYKKWGIKNQVELAIKAFRLNLVPIDDLKEAISYDPKKFNTLTPKELEILSLFAQGFGPLEVARRLDRSEKTIDILSLGIHKKLNIFNDMGIITAFLIRSKERRN